MFFALNLYLFAPSALCEYAGPTQNSISSHYHIQKKQHLDGKSFRRWSSLCWHSLVEGAERPLDLITWSGASWNPPFQASPPSSCPSLCPCFSTHPQTIASQSLVSTPLLTPPYPLLFCFSLPESSVSFRGAPSLEIYSFWAWLTHRAAL